MMFRNIGPTARCHTTSLDWRRNIRHPKHEPYATLSATRKHSHYGIMFGVYWQPDIIETKEEFEKLFPEYPMVNDRSFGKNGIVKKGDSFKLRVRKRTYSLPNKI